MAAEIGLHLFFTEIKLIGKALEPPGCALGTEAAALYLNIPVPKIKGIAPPQAVPLHFRINLGDNVIVDAEHIRISQAIMIKGGGTLKNGLPELGALPERIGDLTDLISGLEHLLPAGVDAGHGNIQIEQGKTPLGIRNIPLYFLQYRSC